MEKKSRKIKVIYKKSSLPEEEKRKLLFKCFDILLSKQNPSKREDSKK